MITVFARDNRQLVLRVARVGIYFGGQTIISFGGSPIALLVFLDELGLAVAGKITELDQSLVTREEDLGL